MEKLVHNPGPMTVLYTWKVDKQADLPFVKADGPPSGWDTGSLVIEIHWNKDQQNRGDQFNDRDFWYNLDVFYP